MEKGLRKEGEFVSIQAPLYDEMPEVAKLWADAQTMKAVGGAIVFQKKDGRIGIDKWLGRQMGRISIA